MRLQREGFKLQDSSENIYFLNSRAGCYEAVTDELHNAIMEGKVCLWDRRLRKIQTAEEDSMCISMEKENERKYTDVFEGFSNNYIPINTDDSG